MKKKRGGVCHEKAAGGTAGAGAAADAVSGLGGGAAGAGGGGAADGEGDGTGTLRQKRAPDPGTGQRHQGHDPAAGDGSYRPLHHAVLWSYAVLAAISNCYPPV